MVFITHAKRFGKSLLAMCLLLIALFSATQNLFAQTKGLIVLPASGVGAAVLDPDNDGYVSLKKDGIQRGFLLSDEQESEIPYKPIPLPQLEPLRDLIRGPKGGFTDFSYVGTNLNPVYTYTSSEANPNLMFRFRLGSVAPNSKGYSILIDTDEKFGVGEDADATAENPGFEVEIVLATNHGVYLYNVDGKSTVSNSNTNDLVATMPVAQYSQKAIALTDQGGDADYFYDFFIPFSEITSKIPSFKPDTKVRMIANTVMAPHSALNGPISDVGGVDDASFDGNQTGAWSFIVSGQVPARIDTTTTYTLPAVRTSRPIVNSPIYTGETVLTGACNEADGTIVTVYIDGNEHPVTTTVSGKTWTLIVPALSTNQKITATAFAAGKSVSLYSPEITVLAPRVVCNTPAPISITPQNNNTVLRVNFATAIPSGSIINIYKLTASGSTIYSLTTTTSATTYDLTICTGSHCLECGSYAATVTYPASHANGACESAPYFGCISISTGNKKCTSVQNTSVTVNNSQIYTSTSSISGRISGATSNFRMYLYVDGALVQTKNYASGVSNWSFSNLTLKTGEVVTIYAQDSLANACLSGGVSRTVVSSTAVSAVPAVSAPIYVGATTIKGTSSEISGTQITVYKDVNGTTSAIGTTTVDDYGNWSLTISTTVLAAGNTVYATASAPGKSVSVNSETVTVLAVPTKTTAPTITGSYAEGGIVVSGTSVSGAAIKLFIDGYQIGNTVASGTNWTVNGLSAADYDLYAGGILTATATLAPDSESDPSNSVVVSCLPPDVSASVASAAITEFCADGTTTISVSNTQAGVIYSLTNGGTSGTYFGASQLGNNGTLTFTTFPFETAGTYTFTVVAEKATTVCSEQTLSTTPQVIVNANPDITLTVTAPEYTCYNTAAEISLANTQDQFRYQLKETGTGTDIGSPVIGNGGTVYFNTGNLTATKTFYIEVIDITKPTNCTKRFAADYEIKADCPAEYTDFTAINPKKIPDYVMDEILATAKDRDNGIVAAAVTAGRLPAGAALRTSGADVGDIFVAYKDSLDDAEYNFVIKTTDFYGGTTNTPLNIKLNYTPLPVSFMQFTAKTTGKTVELNWSTATEKNNSHFIIERSKTGTTFTEVGNVKGSGTINEMRHYQFTDLTPFAGENYYRLKQVDLDGSFEFSKIVSVNTAQLFQLQVYPNPAKNTATVMFNSIEKQNLQLNLVNMQGRQVYFKTVHAETGNNEISLNLEGLPAGMYMIVLNGKELQAKTKLIVE